MLFFGQFSNNLNKYKMSNLKTIQKMKGIVLIVMPDASQHVEVKIPNGITPAQFDAIMNRIKHDFFTAVKPQANADSLVVTTYDESEANN